MRQITNEDVLRLVSLADAELMLAYAYSGLRSGETTNHPRMRNHAQGIRLSTLGGLLPNIGFLGSKTYATCNGNNGFALILFSTETALPIAVLQGEAVTLLKGSVTTALVANTWSRKDAQTLTIFGTGVQGKAHIESILRVRPIQNINIVSRGSADDYIRWVENKFSITPKQLEADKAVNNADIIVTATRSGTPLFCPSAVKAGTFISSIGTSTLTTRELDEALVTKADLIGVEWTEQAKFEAGDLVKGVDWDKAVELPEILSHDLSNSDSAQIRIFKSVGLGLADVAIAAAATAKITGQWDELSQRMLDSLHAKKIQLPQPFLSSASPRGASANV